MKRYDVITLVQETPNAHGIFDNPTEPTHDVMAEVRSIGMKEMYEAMSMNLIPSYVFVLSQPCEYNDERIVIYKNKRYEVIRTYIAKGDSVEITVQPATNSRRQAVQQE